MTDTLVIIVNYRTPDLTLACLDAIQRSAAAARLRIVVVDGHSEDNSISVIERGISAAGQAVQFLPLALNGGFGWANNQAMRHALEGDRELKYVWLINPDALPQPTAVAELLAVLDAVPTCAAAGSRLVDGQGLTLGSAFRFPTPFREFLRMANLGILERILRLPPLRVDSPIICAVDWVTGASVLLRRAALEQAGIFDEGFFLYFEEVELMARLRRAGWITLHVPSSVVMHEGGAATGLGAMHSGSLPAYWFQSRQRYFSLVYGRWGGLAANLAFMIGALIRVLRRIVSHRLQSPSIEWRGVTREGLWPSASAARRAGTGLSELPGRPPAWMDR